MVSNDPSGKDPKKRNRLFAGAIAIGLALLAGATLAYVAWLSAPIGDERAPPRVVLIERGATAKDIGSQLVREDMIRSGRAFQLWYRLLADRGGLRHGEFALPSGMSVPRTIRHLQSAQAVQHRITIPEGLTKQQIFEILNANTLLTGEITFPVVEGWLFPDTYFFTRGMSRDAILAQMAKAMRVVSAELWEQRAPDVQLTSIDEAIILASIVEREAGLAAEQPMVAGVFLNRLRRGWKLQADPTVIYAASKGLGTLDRRIRRSELQLDSPYNTYRYRGLPPGAVSNPGASALAAVLNPAQTSAMYFVADGDGAHIFSETLAEHTRHVRKLHERWRQQP